MQMKIQQIFLALLFVCAALGNNETKTKVSTKINCKNIKCPSTEDPVCVKLKNIYDKKQKHVFVVAFNVCEVLYANCKKGIIAAIVPMRECNHEILSKENIMRRRRAKREISSESSNINQEPDDHTNEDIGEEDNKHDNNNDYDGDKDRTNYNAHRGQPSDDGNDFNNDDDDFENDDDDEFSEKEQKFNIDEHNYNNNDNKLHDLSQQAAVEDAEGEEEIYVNNIGDDYDETKENAEVNFVEYKDSCPKKCPVRQMMVCARCQHKIYRTFLSVCHLRLFNCRHPNEKLELIGRRPCIQSAPFLTGLPKPRAKLAEPTDIDKVLKYIHCRQKGRLGRDLNCKINGVSG